jgi:tRNA(Ile)-lysidine synthase
MSWLPRRSGTGGGNAPLEAGEFERLMAPLGPWSAWRRVAVAVSGGADSLCLALMARGWGEPIAFIVDHGLRPDAAAEAAGAAETLARMGVPARILTITGLRPGPRLAERARAARYSVLAEACRNAGLADLLLGHHAADQAETLVLRKEDGSGPSGLSGMAAIAERRWLRLVRPLLSIPPGRLRATLRARGIGWADDPSNADPAFSRARIRAALSDPDGDGAAIRALLQEAEERAAARARHERDTAAFLAMSAEIRREGFAILADADMPPGALAALIRGLGGAPYTPSEAALAALSARQALGTIGGMRLLRAGRLGPGRLLVREAAAMAPAIALRHGAIWDRRFRAEIDGEPPPDATFGAVGDDAPRLRRLSGLPSAILATLPALRDPAGNLAVPHVPALKQWTNPPFKLRLAPMAPVAGAPFHATPAAPCAASGEGDAQLPGGHHLGV